MALKARLFMVKLELFRGKRILLAYQIDRLAKISKMLTAGLSEFSNGEESADYAMHTHNQPQIVPYSKAEQMFIHLQANNLSDYKRNFSQHLNLCGPVTPPKDFYIQIRVEQDCGVVMTEFGKISLNAGTFHFLKRNDVDHLIHRGFLTHIL